jgi:tetratricopeptide (TPR) repeat protein
MAAAAAEHSGRLDEAIAYHKQAFRKDRADLSAALRALVLLRDHGSEAEADEWRSELLENIGKASSGAFELASWAVDNRDDDLFAAALEALAEVDKGAAIDLAEDAAAAGMTRATARAIPVLAATGKLARGLAQRREAILTRSLERMNELLEKDRPVEAYELAHALAQLRRIPNSQINAERLETLARRGLARITRHVRDAVRSAFAAGEPEQVLAAAAGAGDILGAAPDTAVIVARSLDSLGRQDEALALLRRVVAENPDSFSARRLAARYASLQRDYATALDLYGALKLSDEYASIAPEVERFFAGVERRALKRLRELVDSGQYDEAAELAAAITRQLGPLERTQRELARMARQLRLKLKEIDDGGGDLEEREAILRRLVAVAPGDEKGLRLLALELMRQFRFAEAADYWEKLYLLDPDNESADRNRVRCATLAQRRASISAAESNEVG